MATINLSNYFTEPGDHVVKAKSRANGFFPSDFSTSATYHVYSITTNVTNGTTNAPAGIANGQAVEIEIIPASGGYAVPDTITINGVTGTSGSTGATWTYNPSTRTISITGGNADLTITIACTTPTYSVAITTEGNAGSSYAIYNGNDATGTPLTTISADSSYTASINTGFLFIEYTGDPPGAWEEDSGICTGGVEWDGVDAYTRDPAGFLYIVTGNGTISGVNMMVCLAKGTLISMADGSYKKIEDITYDDDILVWNFDEGCFARSKPLWIMKTRKAKQYNKLTFADGSVLKTIGQHRIFNNEKGKFTYPMTNDTPLNTLTLTDKGEFVPLVAKEVVEEEIEYYNVITNYHMNLFADHILTSCRLNNLYPINNLKFVKTHKELLKYESFENCPIPKKYYEGLRLDEQPDWDVISKDAVDHGDKSYLDYVNRLIALQK